MDTGLSPQLLKLSGIGPCQELVTHGVPAVHDLPGVGVGVGVTQPADMAAYIRENAHIAHHPVGTCKMGTGDDAVVDATLAVRGCMGLRVAVFANRFPRHSRLGGIHPESF